MIGQKVLDLCKLKGVTLRAACQASGLKYSTLHAQISNNRPIPFKTIDKLSRKLSVPLSYFSEGQPLFQVNALAADSAPSGSMLQFETSVNAQAKLLAEQGYHPSIDDVLDWLVHVDFQLKDFDWIKDQVDLYYPLQTDDIMARPHSVGSESLAAKLLGFSKDVDLKAHFDKFDTNDVAVIRLSHAAITPQVYSVTDQAFHAQWNQGVISGSYRKLMAGVRDDNGVPLTLVFCRLINFNTHQ